MLFLNEGKRGGRSRKREDLVTMRGFRSTGSK